MKNPFFQILILILIIIVSGCTTVRSISDSGYRGENAYYCRGSSQYSGELNELSVLGVNSKEDISEDDIKSAISDSKRISLQRGDAVIVIQSGARFPDRAMTDNLGKYFEILPLSGLPDVPDSRVPKKDEEKEKSAPSLNKTLRLAAARSGVKTIIVYWGILESARENIATKTISWVPVVGSIVPDEAQQMRIYIKGAVIDVASGSWVMINPKSFEDKRISADMNRSASDQGQVSVLKEKAYSDFVNELVKRFSL